MLSFGPAWQGPLWLSLIWIGGAAAQEPNPSPYRVPPIYLPRPVRPDVAVARDSLPRGTVGMTAPAFDGDRFVVNLRTGDQPRPKDEDVAGVARRVARAAGWQRDSAELVLVRRSPLATARV